jgi:flagellar biosynthesis GTPase FlhF
MFRFKHVKFLHRRCDENLGKLKADDSTKSQLRRDLEAVDLHQMLLLLVQLFPLKPILKAGRRALKVERKVHDGREDVLKSKLKAESLVEACSADIVNHLSRFLLGSRAWIIELFLVWLHKGPGSIGKQQSQRAFVLYGSAGVGKSTISAKLCCMEQKDTCIYAYHFCRHSDAM